MLEIIAWGALCWVGSGLLIVIPMEMWRWWQGEDITDDDLPSALFAIALGPLLAVVLIWEILSKRFKRWMVKRRGILIRGRTSAKVLRELQGKNEGMFR
jgi:hypothetical protein